MTKKGKAQKAQDKVFVFDTTLRDGDQTPGSSFSSYDKELIAKCLKAARLDIIEAGFPAASDGIFSSVKSIAESVKGVVIAALARANKKDIDRAWEAVKGAERPRIHTFLATSDIHLEHKLKMTRKEALEKAAAAVKYAASLCKDVQFSAEDASRSNLDFVCQVFEAVINAGATTVNFPDTTGYALPDEFAEMIGYVIKNTRNIDKAVLSVHCHNDLGLATANSIAAIKAGARQVELTANGLGERAGNSALEEFVMAVKTRKDRLPFKIGVDAKKIGSLSKMVESSSGIRIQPNKAIVGANAFAHESGIHQDGILKNRQTYEIMNPEDIGLGESQLVLGRQSGRKIVRKTLEERGYELSDAEVEKVYESFMNLADRQSEIYPEDLVSILFEDVYEIPDYYVVEHLQVIAGIGPIPTASGIIRAGDKKFEIAKIGIGAIDSAFKAIAKVLKDKSKLLDFGIDSISGGTNAPGKVFVLLKKNGITVKGNGIDRDIITASIKAYINALNRLWRQDNYKK